MKLRAPNVLVLMSSILVMMAVLTWIIPPGSYQKVETQIPGYGKKKIVARDASNKPIYTAKQREELQASEIPKALVTGKDTRIGVWQVLKAPLNGFGKDKEAAAWKTIGFILLIGGAFGVLNKTGAITAFLMWLVSKMGASGRYIMVPILMFAFSAGGVSFGMAEESIAFAMITVPLAARLGFDTTTGVAIPFIGSQAGFATAFINPFSYQIAKGIAGVPGDVGYSYRIMCWLLVTCVCAALVTWHAWRVHKDPSRSLTPELDQKWRDRAATTSGEDTGFGGRQIGVIVVFVAFMALLGWGSVKADWYISEMSAVFLGMCILCGFIGGLGSGKMADAFMDGAKDLAPTAILLAFAQGILLVAKEGMIIDPILKSASGVLDGLGSGATAQCMYCVQSFINFFVPSGSGQAALTMPIMAPLADLQQVPTDTAVLAYQFGDGFTNIVIPTNPVLMGVITAAGIGYGTWFRWVWKLMLILFVMGMILLALK